MNKKLLNINLNCLIKVKLTDYGKDIFYHQYDELNKRCGRTIIEPRFPDVDSEGYSQFQLWDFMHVYGKHLMLGTSNVIHPLSIYIDEENLKEFIE